MSHNILTDVPCIFQNIVFAIKFFLDYIIPDVPKEIARAIRRVRRTLFCIHVHQYVKQFDINNKVLG